MKKLLLILVILFSTLSYSQFQYVEYDISAYTNVNDLENIYGKVKLSNTFISNHSYVGLGVEKDRISFLGGWYKDFGYRRNWQISNDLSVGHDFSQAIDLELSKFIYQWDKYLFKDRVFKAGLLGRVIRKDKVISTDLFMGLSYKF